MASLGNLTLDLVARIGGFTQPLAQASSAANREMTQIASSVKSATTAIAGAGAAAAAAAAGVVAFTNNAAQNTREMKNMAALANSSTTEFQKMAYASKSVGVEQDKLADILKDTSDRVGDFLTTGGGEMADFFEKIAPRIGMTAEAFRDLSGPQALQKFYNGLEKANLSQSEMTFYMESMADEATALIPLLRDGGAGFAEMAAEADKLGIVLTELDIAKLDEFAGQFDRLSGIFGSMSNILASELAPYLSVVSDELVEAAGGAEGLRESLPGAIRESVAAIGPLLDGLHLARTAVAGLQAAASSVAQGYSFAFLTIQENATKMLDFVAGGINEIISGFNNLPGLEVALIDSFNKSGYMDSLREGYAEVAEFAKDQRQDVADLWNQPMPSDWVDKSLDQVDAKVAEIRSTLASGIAGFKTLDQWLLKTTVSSGGLADAQKEAAKEADQFAKSASSLLDTLYPLQASQREYADQKAMLIRYAQEEGRSNAWLEDSLQRLDREYRNAGDAAEVYGFTGQKAAKDVQEAFDPALVAMERGVERLDDSFADAWRNMLDGSENAFDSLKDIALDTLAEIIHAYTTRQITASLGASLSVVGSGSAAAGQSSVGSAGNMTDLASAGMSLYSGGGQVLGNAGRAFAGTGSTYAGTFGSSLSAAGNGGIGSGFQSLAGTGIGSAAMGIGGGLAGGYLSGELFGSSEEQQLGATIGAVAGSFIPIPVVGTAIGSFLGGALGSLFGGSGVDPNLVFKTEGQYGSSGRAGFEREISAQSALGQVGFARESRDLDYAFDSFDEAQQFIDQVAQLDNAFAQAAGSASGLAKMQEAVQNQGLLDRSGDEFLEQRYRAAFDTVNSRFEDLVMGIEGDAEGFVSAAVAVSQVEPLLSSFSDAIQNKVAASISGSADEIVESAGRMATSLQALGSLSSATDQLNLTFEATSAAAVDAAYDLQELVGGVSNLSALNQQYFDAFYTEQEKFERLSDSLSDRFEDLGLALPETGSGVRDLVEGLDLMTQSGREQYAAVMQLVPSLKQYVDGIQDQGSALDVANERWELQNELLQAQGRDAELLQRQREKELAALDESNRALQRRIWSLQDETEAQEAAAARQQLDQQLSLYSSGVVDATSNALNSYNAQMDAIADMSQARQDQLRAEMQAVESLGQLMDSLMLSDQSILDPAERLQEAQRQFAELQVRAENGDTDAASQLQGASSSYLDAAASYYGQSSSQYASIFGDVTDGVEDLERQFGMSVDQLGSIESIEQQALREQQRARETLASSLTEEIEQSSLLGSIADLIDMLPDSLASALEGIMPEYGNAGTGGGSGGFDTAAYLANKTEQVNDIAQGGRDNWTSQQVLDKIIQDYGSVEAHYNAVGRDEGIQPYFATGGAFTNGVVDRPTSFNMGLMGEAGPEAIMPLANIGGSLGVRVSNESSAEVVRELQALRQEVAMLRAERGADASQAASQRAQQITGIKDVKRAQKQPVRTT